MDVWDRREHKSDSENLAFMCSQYLINNPASIVSEFLFIKPLFHYLPTICKQLIRGLIHRLRHAGLIKSYNHQICHLCPFMDLPAEDILYIYIILNSRISYHFLRVCRQPTLLFLVWFGWSNSVFFMLPVDPYTVDSVTHCYRILNRSIRYGGLI